MLFNGSAVQWEALSVTNNTFYSPDKFEVTVPASSLPTGLQRADLSNIASLQVEIRISLDGSSGTSMIIGVVDEITDNFFDGLISLTGRDRTADFIDNKTTEKFQNQTSSQIVTTLAGRHGLSADVTATTTKAGKYYEIDHDKLTDESTEWDLITYLGQKEGFSAWVTGTTVHFHPVGQTVGDPVVVTYIAATPSNIASGAFTKLEAKRALTLASDVLVNVYSWNHKQKNAFKVTAKATKTKGVKSSGKPQVYTFRVPGLTKDQAIQYAQNKAEEISRHERVIDIGLPGDVTTTARNQIKLQGTQTDYDQLYWISEIGRRLSMSEGFDMTISAKNHSPQSTVTA